MNVLRLRVVSVRGSVDVADIFCCFAAAPRENLRDKRHKERQGGRFQGCSSSGWGRGKEGGFKVSVRVAGVAARRAV